MAATALASGARIAAPRGAVSLIAVVAWAGLILGAVAWGLGLRPGVTQPLVGVLDLRPSGWMLPALAVGVAAVAVGPAAARHVSWRVLLLGSFVLAGAWATALALADGPAAIARPLLAGQEYLAAVPLVSDPLEFLGSFTERIARYPVHVEGHPPGTVLALWGLSRIGLGGAVPAAAVAIGLGASAAPAALIATREAAGETAARRAAPFLALAPYAVWVATSMDAAYMGIGAWSVAFAILATGRTGASSRALAAGAGAVFGVGLLVSYGLAPLVLVPVAAAVHRRRPDVLAFFGVGAAVPLAVAAAGGFWWPDGLAATRRRYAVGIARIRPYGYFLVANLAALALALGPAVAAAVGRVRDRGLWTLAGGAVAAVALADLSGLSKGEVERIWLPFMPWLVVACAALGPSARGWSPARGWLAAQAGLTVAVQIAWRSLW